MIQLDAQSTSAFVASLMQAQRRQVAAEVADFVFDNFYKRTDEYDAGDVYDAILDHFKAHDLAENADMPQR